jgi:hypothetical protein
MMGDEVTRGSTLQPLILLWPDQSESWRHGVLGAGRNASFEQWAGRARWAVSGDLLQGLVAELAKGVIGAAQELASDGKPRPATATASLHFEVIGVIG